jgi:hypothetical protein
MIIINNNQFLLSISISIDLCIEGVPNIEHYCT